MTYQLLCTVFVIIVSISVHPAHAVSCDDLDSTKYIEYYDAPQLCADLPLLSENAFVKVLIGVKCLRLPSTETIPPVSDTVARARWIDSAYSEWWPRNRDTCMVHTDSILKIFDVRDFDDTTVNLDTIVYSTEFPCQIRVCDLPALSRYQFVGTLRFVYNVVTPIEKQPYFTCNNRSQQAGRQYRFVTPAGRVLSGNGRNQNNRAGGCTVVHESSVSGRGKTFTRITF